jgi:hypothetical protein
MIRSKTSFFIDLAKKPDLKNNIISIIFALHPDIDISKREKFYENIIGYFQRYSEKDRMNIPDHFTDNEKTIDNWVNKDFRIKSVKISSVRGFPKSDKPYGIKFTNENDLPQSMIILGSNGSGKSSLYNAIEYAYCKRIGEAQLRTTEDFLDEDEKFKSYLQNFNNGFANSFCEIQTMEDLLSLQGVNIPKEIRRKINPDTHFISDYDIYSKGQLNYESGGNESFHYIIAESLGLSELLAFEKSLKAFTIYSRVTESRQVSTLEKSNLSEQTIIDNNKKAIEGLKEKLILLEENQKALPPEHGLRESITHLNQIKNSSLEFPLKSTDTIKNLISDYSEKYFQFSKIDEKLGAYSELQFLNIGLELLKEHNDCPFCRSSRKGKNEIISEVYSRINNLNKVNESLQALNKSFKEVTDYLNNLNNNIELFKDRVSKEQSMIQGNTELNTLFSTEIKFIEYLSVNQSNDFFITIKDLNEDPKFLKDKFNYINFLLRKNNNLLIPNLSELFFNINKFQNERISIIKEIEQNFQSKSQGQSLFEQILTAKNEISILEKQIMISTENINRNNSEISKFREIQSSYDTLKKQTKEFLDVYHIYLNKEVEQAFFPIQMIVEEILNGYLNRENRNVELRITKDPEETDEATGEVLSEIITAKIFIKGENNTSIPVNRFFNTFHYRLFSTMVGIGIAVASRINTKINLPIVMDDIFYASDFENRARVESFLHEIFEIFKSFTPDIPLQLILFTHDQLIFESAIKATLKSSIPDVYFAKLFPFKDSSEEDSLLNIIYKLPTYLPQSLIQNTLSKV